MVNEQKVIKFVHDKSKHFSLETKNIAIFGRLYITINL